MKNNLGWLFFALFVRFFRLLNRNNHGKDINIFSSPKKLDHFYNIIYTLLSVVFSEICIVRVLSKGNTNTDLFFLPLIHEKDVLLSFALTRLDHNSLYPNQDYIP